MHTYVYLYLFVFLFRFELILMRAFVRILTLTLCAMRYGVPMLTIEKPTTQACEHAHQCSSTMWERIRLRVCMYANARRLWLFCFRQSVSLSMSSMLGAISCCWCSGKSAIGNAMWNLKMCIRLKSMCIRTKNCTKMHSKHLGRRVAGHFNKKILKINWILYHLSALISVWIPKREYYH